MCNGRNHIITAFDKKYWDKWGESFITSIKELAKFEGKIIIIGINGFHKKIKNVIFISQEKHFSDISLDNLHTLNLYAQKNEGNYLWVDGDSYFQDKIDFTNNDELLCASDLSPSNILNNFLVLDDGTKKYSKILQKEVLINSAFILGNSKIWDNFMKFVNFCFDIEKINIKEKDDLYLNLFDYYFPKKVSGINYVKNLSNNLIWQNGFYYAKGEKAKVIHFHGDLKWQAISNNYSFKNHSKGGLIK